MKIKRILTAFLCVAMTINLIIPIASADTNIYENLPNTGITVLSNSQLVSRYGTNGVFDWAEDSTSYVTTDYGRTLQIRTKVKKDASMDIGVPFDVNGDFTEGDVGVISFMGRSINNTTGYNAAIDIIYQNTSTWNKMVMKHTEFASGWQRYNIPFVARENFSASSSELTFWIGYYPQTVQIADFSIVNYKNQVAFEDLTGYAADSYKGRESGAKWREDALERIETYRKGNINVSVKTPGGVAVKDADVSVEMTRNKFNFGAAVTNLLWKNDTNYSASERSNYKSKFLSNFNTAVMEGAMKWDEYGSSNGVDAANTMAYLNDNNIAVRGHCLYWDNESWYNLAEGSTDAEKKESILNHVAETATAFPEVYQWDVINEPVTQRYLRKQSSDGIDFMADIFKTAAQNTDAKLYINELGIQGDDSVTFNRIKTFVPELKAAGARVDGIGVETHCGSIAPSPEDYYNELCELGNLVDEISVTEYDIDVDDEQLAADNLRDMLIAAYSMPKVNSFLVWGFWDKKHWLANAPLYDSSWRAKPAQAVWQEYTQNQWVTNENGKTDTNGEYDVNGYLGTYDVTVNYAGEKYIKTVKLEDNNGVDVAINIDSELPEEKVFTRDDILNAGTQIVSNDNLLNILKTNENYTNKTIDTNSNGKADLTYFHQSDGANIDGVRLQTSDNYKDNSALKIQIPMQSAVSAGDVLVIRYKVDSFKGWDDIGFAQFGITDGTNTTKSNLTKFGKTNGWQTTWAYSELFSAIVADRDYAAGSSFEIYAGFSDWMDVLIGNLSVKNIGSSYDAEKAKAAIGIGVPGIKYVSPKKEDSGCISVRFSAEGATQGEAVKYIASAYDAAGRLLDAQIVEDASGTIATVLNTVPTPIDNRNIPVFDSSVSYDDIAEIKVIALHSTAPLSLQPLFVNGIFTK